MKRAIGIETMFSEAGFYDRPALCKKAGCGSIEFWGWDNKDLPRLKAACESAGVAVAAFSGDGADFSLCDPAHGDGYAQYLSRSIDAALFLNCKTLVIHSNALGEGGAVVNHYESLCDAEKFTACLNTLRRCATLAEKAGVTLVLEPLNTLCDHVGNYLFEPQKAAMLLRAVNSPNVKLLYDVYHMHIMVGNTINNLRLCTDVLGHVHAADVPGRAQPGTGEIYYPAIFDYLEKSGFCGFAGLECFPTADSARVTCAFMAL